MDCLCNTEHIEWGSCKHVVIDLDGCLGYYFSDSSMASSNPPEE